MDFAHMLVNFLHTSGRKYLSSLNSKLNAGIYYNKSGTTMQNKKG